MKILILKPSSLGDVVQALPVLRLLKQHLPHSEIYWWIDSRLAPLLAGDPDLAGIIPFHRRGWASPRNWLAVWRGLGWTRAQSFDWVIDLQGLARSGAFAWLANGKLTVGLDEPRELARGYYDAVAPRLSFHTHAVDWYLEVLRLLEVPVHRSFEWLPPRPDIAAMVSKKWEPETTKWILLQPGARWQNKRWPVEFFGELLRNLADAQPRFRFAVLGGSEDRRLASEICRVAPERCLDLTGQLSLQEMVEWIRLATLMVSNDTGPLHVAAALRTPVVALFGPTEPARTGPYGQLDHVLQLRLPCVPCLKSRCHYEKPLECVRTLPVQSVFAAMQQRLEAVTSFDRRDAALSLAAH